jgi:hypothetical protein
VRDFGSDSDSDFGWAFGLAGQPTGARAAARPSASRPLRARLVAAVFCAATAGGLAITAAGHLVAQNYLTEQADRQLRSYAGLLTARPFAVFPGFRRAPGAAVLGPAGGELGIAVRASGGNLLMSAGPAAPPAAGRGWLEISERVSYRQDHIPFVYGADDFSVAVSPKARGGLPGTLVIGLNLDGVRRAVGGLTIICLAVTGLSVLLVSAAAAGMTGRLLRPPAVAAAAEAAARATWADVAAICGHLRRPLGIVAGLAEYHRKRGGLSADDADRAMRQVAREAERMAALVDAFEAAAKTR